MGGSITPRPDCDRVRRRIRSGATIHRATIETAVAIKIPFMFDSLTSAPCGRFEEQQPASAGYDTHDRLGGERAPRGAMQKQPLVLW
jgi:hypothetical protein